MALQSRLGSLTVPPPLIRVPEERIPQRPPLADLQVIVRRDDASDGAANVVPKVRPDLQPHRGDVERIRRPGGNDDGIVKRGQRRDVALSLSSHHPVEDLLVGVALRVLVSRIDAREEVDLGRGRAWRWRARHVDVEACDGDGLPALVLDGEDVSIGWRWQTDWIRG